jgi:hypothetical protein
MASGKVSRNPHEGSAFEDFLREEGIYAEVEALAVKKVIAALLAREMETRKLSKVALGRQIGTSRSQLDRLLDPANPSVTLLTLVKAAAAIGKQLRLEFVDLPASKRMTRKAA